MGEIIMSPSASNYTWTLKGSLSSTSDSFTIPMDDIKFGVQIDNGQSYTFFERNFIQQNGFRITLIQMYDSAGWKYYRTTPCYGSVSNGNLIIRLEPGFDGKMADATYSRPTTGLYARIYYA